MRAIVEVTGSDPIGLRQRCQNYCDGRIYLLNQSGEPLTESQREDYASDMLADYLETIDPATTGADRLTVVIVD